MNECNIRLIRKDDPHHVSIDEDNPNYKKLLIKYLVRDDYQVIRRYQKKQGGYVSWLCDGKHG